MFRSACCGFTEAGAAHWNLWCVLPAACVCWWVRYTRKMACRFIKQWCGSVVAASVPRRNSPYPSRWFFCRQCSLYCRRKWRVRRRRGYS